jgi:hypothetical protein
MLFDTFDPEVHKYQNGIIYFETSPVITLAPSMIMFISNAIISMLIFCCRRYAHLPDPYSILYPNDSFLRGYLKTLSVGRL